MSRCRRWTSRCRRRSSISLVDLRGELGPGLYLFIAHDLAVGDGHQTPTASPSCIWGCTSNWPTAIRCTPRRLHPLHAGADRGGAGRCIRRNDGAADRGGLTGDIPSTVIAAWLQLPHCVPAGGRCSPRDETADDRAGTGSFLSLVTLRPKPGGLTPGKTFAVFVMVIRRDRAGLRVGGTPDLRDAAATGIRRGTKIEMNFSLSFAPPVWPFWWR